MIGGGTWTTVVGCLFGQILLTAARHAHFFCIVTVRNNAQVTASTADLGQDGPEFNLLDQNCDLSRLEAAFVSE